MSAPIAGTSHVLRHGDAEAVIASIGASLRSYRVAGRDLVVPYAEDEVRPGYRGATLAPWPNRLADGAYTFDGVEYQLPITEVSRGTALHGPVMHERWAVAELSTTRARLTRETVPVSVYPWQLGMSASYTLSGPGLTIEVAATNR
mgnify:CR=1 FL=1